MTVESGDSLSERELEILRLLATGASNKEIAAALFISPNTVKVHVRNIFEKMGVASRTEASMVAVRLGLVVVEGAEGESAAVAEEGAGAVEDEDAEIAAGGARVVVGGQRWWRLWIGLGVVLAVLVLGVVWALGRGGATSAVEAEALATVTPVRWRELAALPTPRAEMAVVAYEGQIITIGGRTATDAAVGSVEMYSPATDRWLPLADKPTPVREAQAVVLGGQVYVPGGRLVDDSVTDVFEVYDPVADAWTSDRAPMPVALAGYAATAFEGRMYVFGGWDGEAYRNEVWVYDPAMDGWEALTPMVVARAGAGAVVLQSSQILVFGGRNADGPLAVNERYFPTRDVWEVAARLPAPMDRVSAVNVSDVLFVFGSTERAMAMYQLLPQSQLWLPVEQPTVVLGLGGQVALSGQELHVVGGDSAGRPSAAHQAYRAVFVLEVPFAP